MKKYKFNTLKDRIVTTGSGVAGLAIFGAGLSLVFNPVALGVATAVGAGTYALQCLMAIPVYKNWAMGRMVKKGRWAIVPDDAPMARITAEISSKLGRPQPPKIYTVDDKTVAKIAAPFGLRWMIKLMLSKDREMMEGIFAAIPGTNTLVTTKEALERKMPESQLRFLAAHEMSHLQAKDQLSPALIGKVIVKKAVRTLFWGCALATGAALVGLSLPVVAFGGWWAGIAGIGALTVVNTVAKIGLNFGLRAVEKRADRNGLYITRDLDSAINGLASLDATKTKSGRTIPYGLELLIDHPSFNRRVVALHSAFNKVSKYPELAAVNDNAAVQPKAVLKQSL